MPFSFNYLSLNFECLSLKSLIVNLCLNFYLSYFLFFLPLCLFTSLYFSKPVSSFLRLTKICKIQKMFLYPLYFACLSSLCSKDIDSPVTNNTKVALALPNGANCLGPNFFRVSRPHQNFVSVKAKKACSISPS